jgi:hypothetical protein
MSSENPGGEVSKSIQGAAAVLVQVKEILKGQPFANIMAILQLVTMAGVALVVCYDLIPGERKAYSENQQKTEAAFINTLERIEEKHTEQLKSTTSLVDRLLERDNSTRRTGTAVIE